MNTQQIFNQTNITNFLVDIPDVGLTKGFTLNAQSANIPGIRIPITDVPSGTMGLGRANLPGSTFEFDPLMIRFLVDEELESWLQMYRWMIGINNYQTGDNFAWRDGSSPEHVSVHILDNSKTRIVLSIHYYGCWISDLGEVEFNTTEDTDPAITCQAILPYKYLQIEKDGKIITTRQNMTEAANSRIGMHPSMRK
ncbi:tail completion and sheath stabilizer protein [Citrobacter phage Moon]|uniref:Sheath stabilizer protein n=3 Tax=Moonvirus TaxID=1985329 RepID=A0A0K1LMR4_9CAUD|nr:tail completion and sheath stabilizer protein [Citrobacter phage Moon]YP_009203884.1 sheath stabilizer protein [Citrobacter phage Merlin]YP_009618224.1 sheath stabilizer protein [Citrobacter phage CF1 ERZ-2017]AIX12135.1 tail completion and sheath stabilizer protein [Citrobacter phage Moon]AKU43816.1 sheath stabilizer protein [Citrobacter phage Merlin]AUE23038.1 sheath stabilizer protein [Citrobacter phage CF1 ERZ-2017]